MKVFQLETDSTFEIGLLVVEFQSSAVNKGGLTIAATAHVLPGPGDKPRVVVGDHLRFGEVEAPLLKTLEGLWFKVVSSGQQPYKLMEIDLEWDYHFEEGVNDGLE